MMASTKAISYLGEESGYLSFSEGGKEEETSSSVWSFSSNNCETMHSLWAPPEPKALRISQLLTSYVVKGFDIYHPIHKDNVWEL